MKSLYVFLSGCMVYVLVAACSAMDPGRAGGGGSAPHAAVVGGAGGVAVMASGAAGHDGASVGIGGASGASVGVGGHGGMSSSAGHGGALGAGGAGGFLDPVPPAHADPTSGTRLKARFWMNADGSKSYLDGIWYDSLLMTDCAASKVPGDSVYRCTPGNMPGDLDDAWVNGLVGFTDAACSTPIIGESSSRSAPKFALFGRYAPPSFRRVGRVAGTSSFYEFDSNVSCVAGTPAPGYIYYTLGPAMAPSEFVEMTMHVEP